MTEFEIIKKALEREGWSFEIFTYSYGGKEIRLMDIELGFSPDGNFEEICNTRYEDY